MEDLIEKYTVNKEKLILLFTIIFPINTTDHEVDVIQEYHQALETYPSQMFKLLSLDAWDILLQKYQNFPPHLKQLEKKPPPKESTNVIPFRQKSS